MKIIKVQDNFVTNAEVMAILENISRIEKKILKEEKNISAILHNTKDYVKKLTPNTIHVDKLLSFVESLNQFELTKAEIMMIFNLMPRSEVELYNIIEMIEYRFSGEQIEGIINHINNWLSN